MCSRLAARASCFVRARGNIGVVAVDREKCEAAVDGDDIGEAVENIKSENRRNSSGAKEGN